MSTVLVSCFHDITLYINKGYVIMLKLIFLGDQVAVYSELMYKHTVADICYHPHDHIIAFCCFKQSCPILIYNYDHKGKKFSMKTNKGFSKIM